MTGTASTLTDYICNLIEEGSATPVTFGTRHAFAGLAVMARLHAHGLEG